VECQLIKRKLNYDDVCFFMPSGGIAYISGWEI